MSKVAVVTGSSYGLGEAITHTLLTIGYKVYGASRSKPEKEDDNFVWIQADLLSESGLEGLGDEITESKVDLLVNNVGTAFLKKALEYTDEDFDKMFALNFKVHAKVTKLLFPRLSGGVIINTSSLSDRYPDPTWGLYGSSKAALNLFFETMAEEEPGVKIVNILPSYVETPLQHALSDGTDFDWSMCMKPEGVADSVKYVLENLSDFETGSRVIVEKSVPEGEDYRPEKLWAYGTTTRIIKKIVG